ncbi:uncharacterized protein BJ171DRAFT_219931 [Polychytrium aggregatum]|uniref:uncharacterized protein n=1 Tax=Polychytrium aggregatum TaxID=110093 RepID=UPI0022FE467A|nr:uncharacterized protein BJ171DRAFT_219931 [Polychytrium aggregatum]KAI9199295.1 hypothetical protein BJ171DRAFT_219931 [Polychytrium aggregatum]
MPFPLPPASKLYFPSFSIKLIRSNLPPHQAVFKVPPQLNKLDISSYLQALYNVNVTDVRTMNYLARSWKDRKGREKNVAAYKKVIITMEDDFYFPPLATADDGVQKLPTRADIVPTRHHPKSKAFADMKLDKKTKAEAAAASSE